MSTPRRVVPKIRSYRRTTASSDEQYAQSWSLLDRAIASIHAKNASSLSFEELYRTAYSIVLDKLADKLYSDLSLSLHHHLLLTILHPLSNEPDTAFLKELKTKWKEYCIASHMVRDIFTYLDRTYVKGSSNPPVYVMAMNRFRDDVIYDPSVLRRIQKRIGEEVRRDRDGEVVDRGTVKEVVAMMVACGKREGATGSCYEEDLEKGLLDASKTYYRDWSRRELDRKDANGYLMKVKRVLRDEEERVEHYLHPSTGPKLKLVVETELIANHLATLINMENSGLASMLADMKLSGIIPTSSLDECLDIALMYELFGRTEQGHDAMKLKISSILQESGHSIHIQFGGWSPNSNPTSNMVTTNSSTTASSSHENMNTATVDPMQWTHHILNLKNKYDQILSDALNADKSFQVTFNEAFTTFINVNYRSPMFVSHFMDDTLKKSTKMSDKDVSGALESGVALFRFVQDKDVFERCYKQHLAKRLLFRSVNEDTERSVIAKLKTECGYQFTSKMEGMFNDVRMGRDLMQDFKQRSICKKSDEKVPYDLSVSVLTTTFWPVSVPEQLAYVPMEVRSGVSAFTEFYSTRHTGRKLTWVMSMGNADVKALIGGKKYEMSVSSYQMAILLLFNSSGTFSIQSILEATNIPESDLKRHLLSMVYGKFKILTKVPKSKDVQVTDTVSINDGFQSPLARIKVPVIASKQEQEEESKKTQTDVEEGRKHLIDATIVRIMKSRRRVEHNQLVSEAIQQLSGRFLPNPVLMKRRIEVLIEKEYLVRDEQDRRVYRYVA